LAVARAGQGTVQVRLGCLEVSRDSGQLAFSSRNGRRDARLLALEQLQRYRVGIVRLEQLLAFSLEPPQPPLLDIAFAVRVSPQLCEFLVEEAPQPHDIIFG